MDKETIPKEGVVRIVSVFLKNGEMINIKGKNAKLEMTGDSKGITYDLNDSKEVFIPNDNIAKLKIEVEENNYWMPVAIIGGVAAFVVVVAIIEFIAIMGHFLH